METKQKTLKISFSSPKGGVGKSTMTILLASVLHYRLGFNVLVMDSDFPQHSISNMRERDVKTVRQIDYYKKAAMKQFQAINKKPYPIIRCKAENALEKASEYIDKSAIDWNILFFDLPGTANTKGVLTTLKAMDIIFSPITADRLVVESSLSFAKAFFQLPETENFNKNQSFCFFWNQVDGRERTELYEAYGRVIRELEFSVMDSRIMDSKRFRKEADGANYYIFRSTLLAADPKRMKLTKLDLFVKEFLKIIHF